MTTTEFEDYAGIEARLRDAVAKCGRRPWAREHGVSRGHVDNVLRGERKPSASIALALGFRMRVVFERIEK